MAGDGTLSHSSNGLLFALAALTGDLSQRLRDLVEMAPHRLFRAVGIVARHRLDNLAVFTE
jgi:hypothetical protein